jgi:hypothetical protein
VSDMQRWRPVGPWSVPDEVEPGDLAERGANPRGQMPSYAVRSWEEGVHADVDSGRARSTQTSYERPQGELIMVRDHDPVDAFEAASSWDRANSRWATTRGWQAIPARQEDSPCRPGTMQRFPPQSRGC